MRNAFFWVVTFLYLVTPEDGNDSLSRNVGTKLPLLGSGVPRNFVRGVGGSINSVEDRGQKERGSGGGSPLVRGSEGSCNLVQFHFI